MYDSDSCDYSLLMKIFDEVFNDYHGADYNTMRAEFEQNARCLDRIHGCLSIDYLRDAFISACRSLKDDDFDLRLKDFTISMGYDDYYFSEDYEDDEDE